MKTIKKNSPQALLDNKCVDTMKDENMNSREKEKAFNELYSRHNQQVKVYFLKRLKDSDVADDLLMITFQKVYENIKSFDSNIAAFSTWLYKIANNSLIDYTRKAKFEVLSLDALAEKTAKENDSMDFQIDSKVANPEVIMVSSEIYEQINDTINSLKSEMMRKVMICRCVDGMSFKEIAKELGVENNSTLRTLTRRGKEIVEAELKHLIF